MTVDSFSSKHPYRYLVCGVRPELQWQSHTISTLRFAETAATITVRPKKTTVQMSAKEKMMVAKLENQRDLIDGLKAKLEALEVEMSKAQGVTPAGLSEQMKTLREALATQQQELQVRNPQRSLDISHPVGLY